MFVSNIDPILVSFGPFEIRYYGLFFVLGFVIAYFLLNYLIKRKHIDFSKDDVADLLLYIIVGAVIGARVFYVFVYNLPFYLDNPGQIIAIWNGGLSVHGGVIGAVLAGLYFAKKRNVDFYEIADIGVIPFAFGLALGRLGNFTNGELYGRITNVSWAVQFPGVEGFRHPSQIYASLKNLLIFFTLWVIKDKVLPRGFMFWTFVIMYSILRFTVEFFRQPDEQIGFIIGFLSMGQILSIITLTVGIIFMYKITSKKSVNR